MDIGTVLHRETARTAIKSRISQLPAIPLLDGENILYLLTYLPIHLLYSYIALRHHAARSARAPATFSIIGRLHGQTIHARLALGRGG